MTRVSGAFAAILVSGSIGFAQARSPEPPRPEAVCAAYDHHVMMLVEDLGLVGEAEPDLLARAAMTAIEARVACRAGDYARATRIYESVSLQRPRMTSFYRVLP
jgi:hypothetical protein